jgi:hypothetical protein
MYHLCVTEGLWVHFSVLMGYTKREAKAIARTHKEVALYDSQWNVLLQKLGED